MKPTLKVLFAVVFLISACAVSESNPIHENSTSPEEDTKTPIDHENLEKPSDSPLRLPGPSGMGNCLEKPVALSECEWLTSSSAVGFFRILDVKLIEDEFALHANPDVVLDSGSSCDFVYYGVELKVEVLWSTIRQEEMGTQTIRIGYSGMNWLEVLPPTKDSNGNVSFTGQGFASNMTFGARIDAHPSRPDEWVLYGSRLFELDSDRVRFVPTASPDDQCSTTPVVEQKTLEQLKDIYESCDDEGGLIRLERHADQNALPQIYASLCERPQVLGEALCESDSSCPSGYGCIDEKCVCDANAPCSR